MKDLFKLSLIPLLGGVVFIGVGVFVKNYTASAMGLFLAGAGTTIILASETKLKKEVYMMMWLLLSVLIAVLIGYDGNLPQISFG